MAWIPEGFISAQDAVSRVAVALFGDVEPDWRRPDMARERLWHLLANGSLGAWRHNAGVHQPIPLPQLWCQTDGMLNALRSGFFARMEKASSGGMMTFQDKIISGELLLDAVQVAALVAGSPAPEAKPQGAYRTGAAGRPAQEGIPLMRAELERRHERGESEASLAAEVRFLIEWLMVNHPQNSVPQQKTTENSLRGPWNGRLRRKDSP